MVKPQCHRLAPVRNVYRRTSSTEPGAFRLIRGLSLDHNFQRFCRYMRRLERTCKNQPGAKRLALKVRRLNRRNSHE